MKPEGKGGDFSDPMIEKIIHSDEILSDLSLCLGEKYIPLVQLLRSTADVHNL